MDPETTSSFFSPHKKQVVILIGILLLLLIVGITVFSKSFGNGPLTDMASSTFNTRLDPTVCGNATGPTTVVFPVDLSSPSVAYPTAEMPRIIISKNRVPTSREHFMTNNPSIRNGVILYEQNGQIHWGLADGECRVISWNNEPNTLAPLLTKQGLVYQAYDRGQLVSFTEKGVLDAVADADSLKFSDRSFKPHPDYTLSQITTSYLVDSTHVYYLEIHGDYTNPTIAVTRLPNADLDSFKVLLDYSENGYGGPSIAVDANTVYVDGKIQSSIKSKTFERTLFSEIFHDGDTYYVALPADESRGSTGELVEFDYNSFAFLPIPSPDGEGSQYTNYQKEGGHVYFVSETKEQVPTADPANMMVVAGLLGLEKGGAKDSVAHYYYAKDDQYVYYMGTIVPGADPRTFRPIENGPWSHSYGADALHVFYQSEMLPNADPKTFEILWQQVYEGCGMNQYSKDGDVVYFRSLPVLGADAATFMPLNGGDDYYGKDARGIYQRALFRSDLPMNFSPECAYG